MSVNLRTLGIQGICELLAAARTRTRNPRKGNRLRSKAARRPVAGGAGVSQYLLGRHVEPGLPDGVPPVQRPGSTSCASVSSCRPKQELAELLARKASLVSLESQTPVGDFDVVAFSVSFEWDYVNVLTLLRLAGIPRYAAERNAHHPLIVVGGAVTFVNPEPLAPFADVVAAGEGEVLVPSFERACPTSDRSPRPASATCAASAAFTSPRSTSRSTEAMVGCRVSFPVSPRPLPVRKAAVKTTDALDPPATSIFTPETEFGSRFLVEVGSRVRQPLSLLLGRLQLPAGPGVSGRSHPAAGRSRPCTCESRGAGVDCTLRPPRHRADSVASTRDGLRDQPRVAATRRSHRVDRAHSKSQRRARDHHRAGNRLGSPAPGHQQDRDE